MHYLLILLSVLTLSCKKENSLSTGANLKVDAKNTFTLQNEVGSSAIRGKILNSLVEEKFPSSTLANAIAPHEELSGMKMIQSEMNDYTEKEKYMSKLVVSFDDRTEIYFLPVNFPLDKAVEILKLQNDPTRVFKWVKHDASAAYAGGKFFLASVNLDDIVKNDQNFYEQISDKKFQGSVFKLPAGQALQVSLSYEMYIQKTKGDLVIINAPSDCKYSSYGCNACTYFMPVSSDQFEKTTSPKFQELNLVITRDGSILDIDELSGKKTIGNNVVKFTVESNEERDSQVTLELNSNYEDVEKRAVAFDANQFCSAIPEGRVRLSRKLETTSEIKILGRGREV